MPADSLADGEDAEKVALREKVAALEHQIAQLQVSRDVKSSN